MRKLQYITMLLIVTSAFADTRTIKPFKYVPNLAQGSKLYNENCAVCHGTKGLSNTSAAQTLKKKPALIGDPAVLSNLSPLKVYDFITQGSDQGMPSYKHLTVTERWDLAAFVFTLNCDFQRPRGNARASLNWEQTKQRTNSQILEILRKRGVPDSYIQKELSVIRYALE